MRVLVACCVMLVAGGARAEPPPRSIDELRAAIAAVLEREGVPGAGIALVAGGKLVWAGGVGLADREHGTPVTADTLFRAGSITKTVVALAVLRLVERGQLDLAGRVADLAPDVAIGNPWEATSPITLAHLLEHTAGFDDMRPNEMYAPLAAEGLPLVDVLARNPGSRQARWPPGARFSYANPGYTVVARILERVTGKPWEEVLRDEVLDPLGMRGARLRFSSEVDARLARGYDAEGKRIPFAAIYHRPAGNLMVSPRELAALVELLLARGGGLVSPAAIARMERSVTAELRGTDVDYGLGNYGDARTPLVSRGHDGGIDGFLSSMGYVPSAGVGWVVLVNSTRSGQAVLAIRALVAAYLLGDAAPPPRAPVPDAELARWAGSYRADSPRAALFAFLQEIGPRLEVIHTPGHLHVRLQGRPETLELVPLGDGCFRLPGASGCHVRFADTSRGRVVFGSPGTYVEEPPELSAAVYFGVRAVLLVLASGLLAIFARRPFWLAWIASLSFFATPLFFVAGARANALGEANGYTVPIFVLSLVFATASAGTLATATGAQGGAARAYRLLYALAAVVATLYLARHGLIGIRLWRW